MPWPVACNPSLGLIKTVTGLAVFDAIADQLVTASAGAWRWLGWNVVEDGRLTRLPAESFGTLPPPASRRPIGGVGLRSGPPFSTTAGHARSAGV